jgi:hypothetical protein
LRIGDGEGWEKEEEERNYEEINKGSGIRERKWK